MLHTLEREKPELFYALPGHVRAAPPRPDASCTSNAIAAICGRMFKPTPEPDPAALKELGLYAIDLYRREFTPISEENIMEVEEWIDSRKGRNQAWKNRLKRCWESHGHDYTEELLEAACDIEVHIKRESYPEYKQPRMIYAGKSEHKILWGPLVTALEEVVYQHPAFIKHIPVAERPAYISRVLGDFSHFGGSDFSSFEGSFRLSIIKVLFRQFLVHMLSKLSPRRRQFYLEQFDRVSAKKKFGGLGLTGFIIALLMSGHMWTSLHNGISNFTVQNFIFSRKGLKFVGVVEGDDGLFGFPSVDDMPTSDEYSRLGFDVKLEYSDDLSTASFCGIVFDVKGQVNTTDPRDYLASCVALPWKYFGYRRGKKLALVRARAMSYHYQYPGCPVIDVLSTRLLALTAGVDVRWVFETDFFDWYTIEKLAGMPTREFTERPVQESSRAIVAEKFGISIADQLAIENFCRTWDGIEMFPPGFDNIFGVTWLDYYRRFGSPSCISFPMDVLRNSIDPFRSYLDLFVAEESG